MFYMIYRISLYLQVFFRFKLIDLPGCFSCHARVEPAPRADGGGYPGEFSSANKRPLDSRLRGNDKG